MDPELNDDTNTEQPGADEAAAALAAEALVAQAGAEGAPAGEEAEAEEQVVMLGDEELPAAEEAKPWVRELRKKFRDQAQELAQFKRGAAPTASDALPADPGAKPQIRDFDFDVDSYTSALDSWHEIRHKRTEAEAKARDQQEQDTSTWQQRVTAYQDEGKKLGFSDFEDCEAVATAELSLTQQGIIVQGAENAALVMYALGRNMALTKKLAAMTDPVKFAFAIADVQRKLTVTKRKPGTKPESSLPASGASAAAALAGGDKKLSDLREEAAKTGDMTKLINYQRLQREAQRQRKAA